MNLFDESENKYYEFVARLLRDKKSYSMGEISALVEEYLPGNQDFDVIEALFSKNDGEELIFKYEDKKFHPIISADFPIRTTKIENQAAKSLLSDEYIHSFLSEGTIEKLATTLGDEYEEWNTHSIYKKNVFKNGVSESNDTYRDAIKIIADAICDNSAIVYDNIRPGKYEFRDRVVFPVKIEFSVLNDQFRICAYDVEQFRFIKMNLETMQNVRPSDQTTDEDLQQEYKIFIKENSKLVKLDVDPVGHVIERCFRIFSYYDRKARFDKEDNKYRLEVTYLKADENEVIKDILSMGSSVTVTEPRQMQKEVYRRIIAASKLYE